MSSRCISPAVSKVLSVAMLIMAVSFTAMSQTRSAQRDSSAVSVIQAAVLALGGSVPTDVVATGTIRIADGDTLDTGTIRIACRGLDQSSEALRTTNRDYGLVYSGGFASERFAATSASASLEMAVTSQSPLVPLPLLRKILDDTTIALFYVGSETLDGAPAFHVVMRITAPNPKLQSLEGYSAKDIWIDTRTGLPRKIAYVQRVAGGDAPSTRVEIAYADFRTVQGMMVPFSISKSVNGTPWASIQLENVLYNTGLTDSDFPVE